MKKWIILILAMLCVVNVYATDNVAVTAGTGTTIAAEDVSGVKYQKVKLIDATASSTTPTGVAASPLQVSLANTGTNGTAVAVSVATIPSHAVTNAGTFATQATLQAGTAEIGKLAAGTAEIGNVKNSGTFATQATLQAGTAEVGKLAAGTAEIGNVKNSGTFAVQAAQSTASNLKTEAHLYDSSTNGIGSTSNALDINIKSGNPTTITATQGTGSNLKVEASNGGTFAVQNTPAIPTLLNYTGSINATTDIVAGGSGKVTYVTAYSLITASATANTLTFQNDATTALWAVTLQALTGAICGANLSTAYPSYLFKTASDKKLTLNFSSGQTTTVSITYFQV
jgi:hypothetical protein